MKIVVDSKIKISIFKMLFAFFIILNVGLLAISYYFYNIIMTYSHTNAYTISDYQKEAKELGYDYSSLNAAEREYVVIESDYGYKLKGLFIKNQKKKKKTIILDEPTNHLDIESREVLEESLINYEGTLLFVSHDRYFVDKIATCIGEIENKKFKMYDFDYEGYKQEKLRVLETLALNLDYKKEKTASQNKEAYQIEKELQRAKEKQKRDIEKLENNILETENKIIELEKLLNTSTSEWDINDYNNKYNEYIHLKESIEDMYKELEKQQF